jgi:hypothetical protein
MKYYYLFLVFISLSIYSQDVNIRKLIKYKKTDFIIVQNKLISEEWQIDTHENCKKNQIGSYFFKNKGNLNEKVIYIHRNCDNLNFINVITYSCIKDKNYINIIKQLKKLRFELINKNENDVTITYTYNKNNLFILVSILKIKSIDIEFESVTINISNSQ